MGRKDDWIEEEALDLMATQGNTPQEAVQIATQMWNLSEARRRAVRVVMGLEEE